MYRLRTDVHSQLFAAPQIELEVMENGGKLAPKDEHENWKPKTWF